MNDSPLQVPTADLQRQRDEIRRGLFRVNTAVLVIVTVVLGLAVAAIFAAYQANERTADATEATQSAREQLWQSYLAQATAGRLSSIPGRKQTGRHIIEAAARIRSSIELRNESIANMGLLDFASERQVEVPNNGTARACCADLSEIALVNDSGMVEVYRTDDQQMMFRWQASGSDVSVLLFSPHARYLLIGYRSGGLEVLNLRTGAVPLKASRFSAVDFSSDDSVLGILENPKTVEFVQVDSGASARPAISLAEAARDLAFDLGDRVALNLGRAVEIWNWRTGERLSKLPHDYPVYSMSWSPHQFAVGDEAGGIRIWDAKSLRPMSWPGHKSLVDLVLFDHRGDLLLSDSWDGSCKIWNPRTGQLLLRTTRGFGVAFSADDMRLGYFSRNSSGHQGWGWWQMAMPQSVRAFDCVGAGDPNIFHIDFSPDGHWLSVLKNDELRVLDFESGQVLGSLPLRNARSAYFLADGHSLLTCADNRLAIRSPVELKPNSTQLSFGEAREIATSKVSHLDGARLSQNRRHVAYLANDSEFAVAELAAPGNLKIFSGAQKPEMGTPSPDGKWLVAGTFHGRGSTVWDASTGSKMLDLDVGNSNPFFSPDGRLLVCAGEKDYRVYDAGTWKLRYRASTASVIDLANYAAFSPDGQLLALVKERQLVNLVKADDGSLQASLVPPEPQIITWLIFSPDGGSLAAGTTCGLVQVWNLRRIHQDLATLNLDWEETSPAKSVTAGSAPHPRAPVLASAQFIASALLGVAVVVSCAGFVLRRQRQLFSGYVHIDNLMERRNRELKVAQTELMHSQKMKALGTLAAGIAHDFNNLLSVIRMSNKLIGRKVKSDPELEENIQEVEEAVQQGKQIVSSMLGFGTERTTAESGGCYLPDLVEDTVGLLSRQFLSGITLDLQLDRDSLSVNVPRARLEQILLNLIVNAAEAMNGKGHLRIQVRNGSCGACDVKSPRPAPRYVELVVSDSGCGIPEQVRSRIFEPFFTTKAHRANPGTGLGLSMIYTLAEQDGLGLGLHSVPGEGACFRVVIPADSDSVVTEVKGPVRQ